MDPNPVHWSGTTGKYESMASENRAQYISGLRIVGRWAPGMATILTHDSSFWSKQVFNWKVSNVIYLIQGIGSHVVDNSQNQLSIVIIYPNQQRVVHDVLRTQKVTVVADGLIHGSLGMREDVELLIPEVLDKVLVEEDHFSGALAGGG